jgi:hypothetical protein
LQHSATWLVQQLTQPSANRSVANLSALLSPWELVVQCALSYLLDQRANWPKLLALVEQTQAQLSGLYAQTQLLLFASLMEAELAAQGSPLDSHRLQQLWRHQARMQYWARLNPSGFCAQAALLDAELSQLNGHPAEQIYERALLACEKADCLGLTAITLERYSRYCRRRGLLTQARLLKADAQRYYQRWGALALLTDQQSH